MAFEKTIKPNDIYQRADSIARLSQFIAKGYRVIDFRPPQEGELYFCPESLFPKVKITFARPGVEKTPLFILNEPAKEQGEAFELAQVIFGCSKYETEITPASVYHACSLADIQEYLNLNGYVPVAFDLPKKGNIYLAPTNREHLHTLVAGTDHVSRSSQPYLILQNQLPALLLSKIWNGKE